MTYYNNSGSSQSDVGQDLTTTSTTSVTAVNSIAGVGATSDTSVIIGRQQQRRGLKQDLPQPLRPGEFGFTTDSQQLFIGADPLGAPSFNRTSVFEDTPASRRTTETIVDHQLFKFSMPFKKYAKGELSGSSQTLSWLPTSDQITGSTSPVFAPVFTVPNTVVDIRNNSAFGASGITVKRNGVELQGNNVATYGTLVTEDYTFTSTTRGDVPHNLTFRTVPQSNEEITVSYYGVETVNQTLSSVSGAPVNTGSIYPGTAFKSFHETYEVPPWDRISNDLISYSDTTGTGFIGMEFKHISVRVFGDTIQSPDNITLGNLYVRRNDDVNLILVDTGNISRSQANSEILSVPVGLGAEFSNTGIRNHIVLDAGALDNGSGPSEEIWFDLRFLPIDDYNAGIVSANISVMGQAYRSGQVTSNANVSLSDIVLDGPWYNGLEPGDQLRFHSGAFAGFTATLVSNHADRVVVDATGATGATSFSNYGANIASNQIQIVSVDHGFTAQNSPNVYVLASSDQTVIGLADPVPAAIDFNQTTTDTLYLPRLNDPSGDIQIKMLAEELTDYGVGFGYYADTLVFDLSAANTVAQATAIVNDAQNWPLLVQQPQEFSDDGVRLLLMQNPAYDSVGHEFSLREDPLVPTLASLSLPPGTYTRDDTRRAQLEKWFDQALDQADLPVYNSVQVGQRYTANASMVSNLTDIDFPVDEAFNELVFRSREEALAFNKVVNNLYYRGFGSDIRGLVNIKSNLEIELKSGVAVGERVTTFLDVNQASIPETAANSAVVGAEFNTSQYQAYFLEYTLQEAENISGVIGANYSRIGTLRILGRNDFDGTGVPEVVLSETGDEIADTNILPGGVTFSAAYVPGTNTVQLYATNNTGIPLVLRYVIRRWGSGES